GYIEAEREKEATNSEDDGSVQNEKTLLSHNFEPWCPGDREKAKRKIYSDPQETEMWSEENLQANWMNLLALRPESEEQTQPC
ncbi:hypothetical protein ANANG_G00296010, partial [Anguilla anguilla]